MNTKILMSGISVVSALAMMGGATFAAFSAQATSTGNVFAAGTMSLLLTDTNEANSNTVTASFGGAGMVPNGTPVSGTLQIKNSGTVAGGHAFLKAANTVTDTAPTNPSDLSALMKITTLTLDGNNVTVPDANANGIMDLNDLQLAANNGVDLGPLVDLNINHLLIVAVQLDNSASNEFQGDSVSTNFTVTLTQ